MQECTIRRKENQSISMEAGFQSWKTLKILTPETIYSSCNSPGQNTGAGSCSLLQRIFPAQGSNPGLLHCRQILYLLSLWESPRILEWVAYPFSRGSFPSRNRTRIFCIAGGFLTSWATREAPKSGKETKGEVVPCCFHGNKQSFLFQSNHPKTDLLSSERVGKSISGQTPPSSIPFTPNSILCSLCFLWEQTSKTQTHKGHFKAEWQQQKWQLWGTLRREFL